ncbi:serine/threonine-protein kinase [Nannocystis sp.]|uniref:serine/threonine-protein kinase n=1 Tax=Nannocystis sp. TaxID=1962667 RepID=UPI0026010849|nr:serine/threonine-protein kinase [Nannocystis sp.]MBK7826593.1 protein kinase [Nannocystis sp.]
MRDEAATHHDEFPRGFGKFVLLREMARGGMGALYLAAAGEHGGLEKLCVVKTLLADADADEDGALGRRFFDEARVVVRLNHANLVQVFDVGAVEGQLYLAMELVDGKDLRAVWNRCAQLQRRIPVDIAVFVVRELLRGLAYVHDAMGLGLVHRDISPPNILVGYRGEVKLTDFGLAKSVLRSEITSPGRVLGRFNYLSPEQARGQAVDRRTDIYAAGIVLWELLTGRQLFSASVASHGATLAAARDPFVRAPSELVPEIPDGLDSIVLRALGTEREQRYQTADRFRASLSEILARNYPSCDTDRIGGFMRDIFARDHKFETHDYASYVREDFSRVREQGRGQDAVSLSDSMDIPRRGRRAASESRMADIEEMGLLSGHTAKPTASTREEAEQRWGTVVAGRYRVEDLQVFDGMGALYRARDTERGVPCALRVLPEIYAREPEVMARFMADAQAAQELKHPNIAQVFDIGKLDDGAVYAVTELLDGQSLATIIQEEGRISPGRAVHVASQVCRALGTAHESGIIHRDFKPSNIVLVAQEGDLDFVKVVDFGICSHVDSEPSTTTSQQELIIGSPDYMAPEQAAGAEANPACDIYALGAVLFETLSGRLPYKGRNAIDVLIQKGARDAPRVTDVAPDVPEGLADVIAACLSRRPEERPSSMRVLEVELLRALDSKAPRPVKSAVAAALAGAGVPRLDTSERSANLPLPPPPESASSSSMRAPVSNEASASGPRTGPASGPSGLTPVTAMREERREPSSVQRPPEPLVERPTQQDVVEPVQQSSNGWLWLVAGGTLIIAAVLLYPQLFGGGPVPPKPDAKGGEVVVKTSADVAEPDEPDTVEPEPPVPPPAPTHDPMVIVTRAELALGEGRLTAPAGNNLSEYLQQLATLDAGNEAIARLRGKAVEGLLAKGSKELADKHAHEAAAFLRELFVLAPDNKDAIAPFTEAVLTESRILRHMKAWDEILPLIEEVTKVNPKSFDAQMLRGQTLAGLGRWTDAVEAYKAATALRKKDKPAKAALAEAKKKAAGK